MDPIKLEDITPDIYAGPLHARQVAAGAGFYEDLGSLWTRSFGDPVGEYWAVRREVGLWDISSLVKYRFTGPDALAAVDRLTTRKVIGAKPGVIRYGAVLNEAGMMLDEGTVYVVSGEEAFYFGNDERAHFVDHLSRHTADLRVTVENVTQRIANVAVQGPRSFDLLSGLTGTDFSSLRWFRFVPEPVELGGVRGMLSRSGFTGELGYEFFLDRVEDAERLWDAILGAGARPFGLDAAEMLRIEAGLLIQEEDYFPGETHLYEMSLDAFIDMDAHDFVGRAAVAATIALPPRRLMTLEVEGDEVPQHGTEVTCDGARVGEVTSAVASPRFGVLALAVLESTVAREGGSVEAGGRRAAVRRLPIDDPRKLRPRSDPRNPLVAE